jgi:hypothetical protein
MERERFFVLLLAKGARCAGVLAHLLAAEKVARAPGPSRRDGRRRTRVLRRDWRAHSAGVQV